MNITRSHCSMSTSSRSVTRHIAVLHMPQPGDEDDMAVTYGYSVGLLVGIRLSVWDDRNGAWKMHNLDSPWEVLDEYNSF